MSHHHLSVAVAGGGIGGLTAALALAGKGFRVRVLEQSEGFEEAGAGLQLSPNCSRVLLALGLGEALARIGFLPSATQFRQWKSGKIISESPLGESARSRYGAPYYHVHRGDLLAMLVDAASQNDAIELMPGCAVHSLHQDSGGVSIDTTQGSMSADVVVGADGIHSVIHRQLWPSPPPVFTGNIAWRTLVPVDRLPSDLIRPMSTVWWGPGKHFVHYYVRSGELVNCVCVVEKQGWEIESWTVPGDREELRADFAGWHDTVEQLIAHMDVDSLHKWALFDREPMTQWGRGRVTLLGDACHPTLPFMAQGAAMAIEDAAVLANCLQAFSSNPAAGLQRYEDLRRARTASIQKGSRRNAQVFHLSGVKAFFRDRAATVAGPRTMDKLYSYDPLAQF